MSQPDRALSTEDRFYRHALELLRGIGPSSDPSAILSHPSYQAIVDMGQDAVPFLLRETAERPTPLIWVYVGITGEVPPSARPGLLRRIREWIW